MPCNGNNETARRRRAAAERQARRRRRVARGLAPYLVELPTDAVVDALLDLGLLLEAEADDAAAVARALAVGVPMALAELRRQRGDATWC